MEGFEQRRPDDRLRKEVERLTALVEKQDRFVKRRLHPAWFAVFIAGGVALGTFLPWVSAFLGIRTWGPGLVNEVQDKRIGAAEVRISNVETLMTSYVVSNCLDTAQAERLRQAQVPCARLLYEKGILPRVNGGAP